MNRLWIFHALVLTCLSDQSQLSTASPDQLSSSSMACGGNTKLRYVRGNALTDNLDCIGLDGRPYPRQMVEDLLRNMELTNQNAAKNSRQGRAMFSSVKTTLDVAKTTDTLMSAYQSANQLDSIEVAFDRAKRSADDNKMSNTSRPNCQANQTPSRLCKSSFNTTAPMYGVSLTSGKPVTIVQKFPDLLQQVVYETCDKSECEVLQGECVQTFIPYLFLVIPLGPVTLTGQDYVLVESGCTCKPKYSVQSPPNPASIIPNFNQMAPDGSRN